MILKHESKSRYTFAVVFVFLLSSLLFIESCKVSYSLSGVNLPPEIKTYSVAYFPNRAPVVQATLSQKFTDALKDKITGQTNLDLVNGVGDVDFSGEIKNYRTSPTAITGDEVAALNRLTITVRVKFTNNINPDDSFDTSFSRYEDYPSDTNLADVEDDLIDQIVDQLVEDIFNKAFVNW
ncbi:MAG TPA: LptE family protein [Bacteroidales bacterium]|nr:LptE family protein [Bacteroidales bacterium]